jgi:hypothetical protein
MRMVFGVPSEGLAGEDTCRKGTVPTHDMVNCDHLSVPFRYVCNTHNYITEVYEMQVFCCVYLMLCKKCKVHNGILQTWQGLRA